MKGVGDSKYLGILSEGQPSVAYYSMPVMAPQVTPGYMTNKDSGRVLLH